RHTPSLSAQEVKALLDARRDVVIVDSRRYEEFQTMSIPTATSVPGAELVLRIRELAPDPTTQVIVNCAGRTRSIIGTPESVAEQMHALKERFVADELIVLTVAPSYKARLRSYELLADAFALPSPASA
ncbi:rhodanese-like domain-containing protein, partial [Escherichia coli]|uniref:rhodanese-like domain-containing protein n=1 Tax=Escherichia coli TaxID=562 RepID=UPI002245B084